LQSQLPASLPWQPVWRLKIAEPTRMSDVYFRLNTMVRLIMNVLTKIMTNRGARPKIRQMVTMPPGEIAVHLVQIAEPTRMSDVYFRSNTMVRLIMNVLTKIMTNRGARPKIRQMVTMPPGAIAVHLVQEQNAVILRA